MANKEPGIKKIDGVNGTPHYRVQIRLKGYKHLSRNFPTLAKAKAWRIEMINAMKSGLLYETTEMRRLTVGNLIDRYIQNELSPENKNYKTLLGQLQWWKEEIGHCLLTHIKEDLIGQILGNVEIDANIFNTSMVVYNEFTKSITKIEPKIKYKVVAEDINDLGWVVGSYYDGSNYNGILWTPEFGAQILET